MGTVTEIIHKGFKAVLSTKHEVKLDPGEIEAVVQAVEKGMVVRVRQGIINPSYLVAVVEDTTREVQYASGVRDPSKMLGIRPLRDIFADKPPLLGNGE